LADASKELQEAAEEALDDSEDSGDESESDEEVPVSEPDVYTCDFINDRRKGMTELQWDEYASSLTGKRIKYEGEVTEVYEDGRIQIDACSGIWSGGVFVIYGTPKEDAIEFSLDQFVKGEGTIKEVGTFLLMYINVYGETLE